MSTLLNSSAPRRSLYISRGNSQAPQSPSPVSVYPLPLVKIHHKFNDKLHHGLLSPISTG